MAETQTSKLIYHMYGPYSAYAGMSDTVKGRAVYFCTDTDTEYAGCIIFNSTVYGMQLTGAQLGVITGVDLSTDGKTLTFRNSENSVVTSVSLASATATKYGLVKVSSDLSAANASLVPSVSAVSSALNSKANLASPVFTGTPKLTTATASSATGRVIPDAAFVLDQISKALTAAGAMRFRGVLGSGSGETASLPTAGVLIGDTYIVSSAGIYGPSGNQSTAKAGDLFVAKTTSTWYYIPSGNEVETFLMVASQPSEITSLSSQKSGLIKLGSVVEKMYSNDWVGLKTAGDSTRAQYVPTAQVLFDMFNEIDNTGLSERINAMGTEVNTKIEKLTCVDNSLVVNNGGAGTDKAADVALKAVGPSTTGSTSAGDTTAKTPGFGGSFKALSATVDKYGRVTALAAHNVTIPSTSATASVAGLMSPTDKKNLDTLLAAGVWYEVS